MRVRIEKQHRDKLKSEAKRTGQGPSKLLRGKRGIAPEGLTSSMIHGWMSGATGSAKDAHIEWVFEAYANWQPPPPATPKPEKITITERHFDLIQAEVTRTGLGAIDILRHAPKPLPNGLNHQKVQRWISGDTKTAIKANWELVIKAYGGIPL